MTPESSWSWLADWVLGVHVGFIAFVVVGQGLIVAGWIKGWAWTRRIGFRGLHLLAIGFVTLESWFGQLCPLTVLEDRLRAAPIASERSLIREAVHSLFFYSAPEWVFTTIYTLFAGFVAWTWLLYPPRRKL